MRIQPSRIICATDLSDYANQTVVYGTAIAKLFNAKLYVCHVTEEPYMTSMHGHLAIDFIDIQKKLMDTAKEQLDEMMADHKIDWEAVVVPGHVPDEITTLVQEKKADLVITAAHVKSGLKRLILGSVTEHLMRTLQTPLLVLRGPKDKILETTDQDFKLKRILVGCDFSADSNLAFNHALSFAQEFQAELHLAHVTVPPVFNMYPGPYIEPTDQPTQRISEEYQQKLKDLFPEDAANWCTHKIVVLAGHPHEELNDYAKANDIDLIVLGTRGIGMVETLFIGSTTDRLIRHATCPVLSVCHKPA